ncbi:MAG: site-specific integrase [Methanofastidiosum sp.]
MASVKVILYEHKKLKDGSHPILVQVIKDRKRKTISTGHSALKSQWNKKSDLPNSKHPNQSLLTSRIKRIKTDINDIVLTLENKRKPFNVEDIINAFKRKKTDITFQEYCNQLVNSLKESGKTGNSNAYLYCSKSVNSFIGDKEILLDEIDYKFVKNYKEYLQKKEQIVNKGTDKEYIKKLSDNGISFYLRTLRAIINKAIKDDLIDETSYPFKNISIKSQKTRKRAVNKDVIKMVEELDVSKEENLQFWKDLFMFSFYNRGMNFVDMAFLKVKNIENARLNYTRQKTGQQFSIKITEKARVIIDRYNDLKDPESYVFPIIYRKGKEYMDYRNAMRLMNKKLKKISNLLKLDVPLTTYVSRHSWATIAKRSGIATAVISEGLGHESEETTQVYLDSFENNVLDDANDLIIS